LIRRNGAKRAAPEQRRAATHEPAFAPVFFRIFFTIIFWRHEANRHRAKSRSSKPGHAAALYFGRLCGGRSQTSG